MLRSFMGFFIMGAAVLGVCVHVRPAAAQPAPAPGFHRSGQPRKQESLKWMRRTATS